MSEKTSWVALDKTLTRELPRCGRPYTKLEAMFSLTVDLDNGIEGSIKGYAKLWGWSRNKVRKFVTETRTPQGHLRDTLGTLQGHPIRLILLGLENKKDTTGTPEGHPRDTPQTPTNKTDTNTNKKITSKEAFEGPVYRTKKGKKLSGEKLTWFEHFWEAYDLKKGKADAADAWDSIPDLNRELAAKIYKAAKMEATARQRMPPDRTPKWAQGWLAGRRWEDDYNQTARIDTSYDDTTSKLKDLGL